MPAPIVECIPNFSEARRPEVIEAIRQAIQGVPQIHLLDQHSDLDHNRTVLTFVGPPAEVEEAAFRAIARAAELIDLDRHRGEHPRIGATDVVPFVPISGVDMTACIEMARRLGRRVGEELGIPVYLYEEAATRPERQNLENLRRGQYEALKEEIATQESRAPDFGPPRLGPAGATVIGARHPLIAYNVYLTTDDVSVAKKIAKALRFSSGGLRFVKALGLLVEGRAQVSMNLTNYRQTPLARVVELVRLEARRYGVDVHHSELVGLIPQEALEQAATWYLQLDGFEPGQVLERRLAESASQEGASQEGASQEGASQEGAAQAAEEAPAPRPDEPQAFLDALAAGTAAPGGGSAAAYAGAMAAALAAMLARLTVGKKKYAAVEAQMQAVAEEAERLRADLAAAVRRDAAAFQAVMAAYRLTQETPEQQAARLRAVEEATLGASREPLQVVRAVVRVMELLGQALEVGNLNALSDGASGFSLARAALAGAGLNVRINLKSLQGSSRPEMIAVVDEMNGELQALEERAAELERRADRMLSERAKVPAPW